MEPAHARRDARQAALLMLGVLAALLAGVLVLLGVGQALGVRGKLQRAADLTAMSGAQVMRREYGRLSELASLEDGSPNPRHLSNAAYLALARGAALRGARRNGVPAGEVEVSFPPRRLRSHADRGRGARAAAIRLPGRRRRASMLVRARAVAESAVPADSLGMSAEASGGGDSGPLAYRQGKPMRPDVAAAFDRMAAAARGEAGLNLSVTSGFRSDAEQARLFAANPNPK